MKNKPLDAGVLKLIAVITMAIDHTAASVVINLYFEYAYAGLTVQAEGLWNLYWVLRGIGRMAFPIYCFLLVEGVFHTRSKARYARNLFLFALISEIPFDLALFRSVFDWENQNVFFTLLFGMLAVSLMQYFWEKLDKLPLRILAMAGAAAFFIFLGWLCKTDYGAYGVGAIIAIYLLRRLGPISGAAGPAVLTVMSGIEAWSFFTVPLYLLYNGRRGRQKKWFFYAFYPAHFMVLWLIMTGMGI